ncbi:MAG TPA: S9 family peptidase [Acidimicrobiales bacterium]|nr:S9 family peptidase [Acidimicrobiales bacterium]
MAQPRPRKDPVTRERHGRTAVDEYTWMRDDERTDPDVLAHLEAENAYTAEVLAGTVELQERIFQEIKGRVQETDLSVPTRRAGWWYYSRTIEGEQYPVYCRLAAGDETDPPDPDDPAVKAAEQVLLDANAEAAADPDHDYFSLGVLDVSPDHGTLAWAADRNGSERHLLRFRDLATGEDRRLADGSFDEVVGVYYSNAWSADGGTIFYTRPDEATRPHEVWRHRLGTPPSEDVLVHREDDERFFCEISETKDRQWLVLQMGSKITSEVRVGPSVDPTEPFHVLVPRRQGIEATVEHVGGTFFLLTNDDALDFRVVSTSSDERDLQRGPDPSAWVDVVPHTPGVRIEGIDVLRDHLLVEERTEATTRIRVRRLSTGDELLLDQPEEVSTVSLGSNPDMGWPQLRHTYTSLVTPPTVIDVDVDTGARTIRKVQPVLGGYDPGQYVSRRLWATADDGTRVPISLVHRRDREPGGPVLLYGYGSYEISIDPGFSIARLSLLDRGWAFAIGHVRGGGEMGRRWYLDGKLEAKANTFDDLIACGRALLDDGVAGVDEDGRPRVAIRGGSAGGLLVGAALNRAPEQWAAVVAEVPFVDALDTILDPTLPLTVIEWEEWGNPGESEEIFDLMASYAPYENIPERALPPVLATSGLHDPRVGYWEPAKWVARLRDRATGGPFLLKTELGAGHGGPSGRYDAWRDEALVLAFLVDAVGEGRLGAG